VIQHDHLLHCEFNPCQIRDGVNQAYLTMFCTAAVHAVQARKNLQLVRGTKDVDREFNDLVEFAKLAAECKHPWRTLFSKKYRPQLILSACSTGFQQWTGYVYLYALFNPDMSILIQKCHFYIGNPKSETSGDSNHAFLHCGDV